MFPATMLCNQRIMMVKQEIIKYHGRVENIQLFSSPPTDDELEQLNNPGQPPKIPEGHDEPLPKSYIMYENDSEYLFEIWDGF